MTDSFTFHLNSPMTEDDWNKIRDVELEHTEHIWYSTPSGRRVDFINANVLDKIRAEIDAMPCAITSMREKYVNRDKVISIIDKYKAEGGGKE